MRETQGNGPGATGSIVKSCEVRILKIAARVRAKDADKDHVRNVVKVQYV